MNKELFSIITTPSENHYYYDTVQQILTPLDSTLKYILENFLINGEVDTEKCKKDLLIKKLGTKEIDYYFNKIAFWKDNGFLSMQSTDEMEVVTFSKTDIENSFASSNHISLEVTEKCNLKCKYCIYGDYYNHYSHRDCSDMKFETAKTLIDYKLKQWFSHHNNNAKITKLISFYGGEPLLNFKLIEQVVEYTKKLSISNDIKFMYNITVNGVLLDKYMDFLIENNFFIAISLDGNEQHNQYRVFPNDLPSFKNVIENIEKLISINKLFFDRNVIFNTVLHQGNNATEIARFFQNKFNKTPLMSEISPITSNPKLKGLMYIKQEEENKRNFSLSIDDSDLFTNSKYICHYNLFFYPFPSAKNQINNGTCVPFSKCVFMTAKGLIFPCERISHDYIMGEIKDNSVCLDYQKAADVYNKICLKYKKQCVICYKSKNCRECLFTLNSEKCSKFMTKEMFANNISTSIFSYEKSINEKE
jgi:uncharacterized protein